jgi:Cu(I)/Ag(I) efflux system membrane protein CusA/SilA
MINRLVDVSLRYRYVVLAVYVCLGAWGYVALRQTSIDALPDLSDHQVIVFTDWPDTAHRKSKIRSRFR